MSEATESTPPELPLLSEPASGVPNVIDTQKGLVNAAKKLASGRGPIAVDAERASGIRYGQRAFLAQFKREGAGIFLIDTETLSKAYVDFSPLAEALEHEEWILHAANQDLPCLDTLGLHPSSIFDTEIAARLAGFDRVGLGAVVEKTLGVRLAKEHSNSDWSKRPLPLPWLTYAALDVEVLAEVRDALIVELASQGKLAWAYEEFDFALSNGVPSPRQDPWRRTSGMQTLKSRRQVSMLRCLWQAREHLAERKDVSPSFLLPDSALISAVKADPSTVPALLKAPGFHGRFAQREAPRWLEALKSGARDENPPPLRALDPGKIPPHRTWAQRHPEAHERLISARSAVAKRAEELKMPTENLLQPSLLRELSWDPPSELFAASIQSALLDLGARPWQSTQAAPVVSEAFLTASAN